MTHMPGRYSVHQKKTLLLPLLYKLAMPDNQFMFSSSSLLRPGFELRTLAGYNIYIYIYIYIYLFIVSKVREVHPRTGHEGPEGEQRYSSTLSLTSALDGGGWPMSSPGRFTPGKEDPVPIVQEVRWVPGPVWTGAENLAPTGIQSPVCPARSESLYRLCYPGALYI